MVSKVKTHSPLLVIFLTVFIDLIGFGMIIPLSPYLATQYNATAFEVGLLMAVYSAAQFLFAPLWGWLSDHIGRRPVLLMSLLGNGISYLGFAFADELWMLFASRIFAGVFAANIATAMAYIADVTEQKDRSIGMGVVGAAFGIGFIFGPFFGAIFAQIGESISSLPPFGMQFSALMAAILCLLNFVFAFFVLKESLTKEKRLSQKHTKSRRLFLIQSYLFKPTVGALLWVGFLANFAMAHMEATLFLFVKDQYDWDLPKASFAFAYVGVVMALTQGVLIRRLLPIFGERKLMIIGIVFSGIGLGLIGVFNSVWLLALVVTLMALGMGLRNPSLNGSISLVSSAQEQGQVMGVNQSLSALARILGPAIGGYVYGSIGMEYPFYISGAITLIGLPILWKIYDRIPDQMEPTGDKKSPSTQTNFMDKRGQAGQDGLGNYNPQGGIVITPKPSESKKFVPISERTDHPLHQPKEVQAIHFIQRYQWKAIVDRNVPYLLLDLRVPTEDLMPRYVRSQYATKESALEVVKSKTHSKQDPIIVICEDGLLSQQVAELLAGEGYINLVVVREGVSLRTGLDS